MNRLPKILGLIALTPVVLVAGCYVVKGGVGTVQVAKARRQAVTDVHSALPTSDAAARQQQRRLRSVLADTGRPTYSWRELDCDLVTDDAGWIVQNWVQECEVRTVDLFAVAGTRAGDCQYVPLPPAADPSYRSHVTRGPTNAMTTFGGSCPDGLTAPPRRGVSRVLDGSRPTDLSSSPAWLVAESRTPVSRTVLGCSPWGVVFCGEPVHRAMLGSPQVAARDDGTRTH